MGLIETVNDVFAIRERVLNKNAVALKLIIELPVGIFALLGWKYIETVF